MTWKPTLAALLALAAGACADGTGGVGSDPPAAVPVAEPSVEPSVDTPAATEPPPTGSTAAESPGAPKPGGPALATEGPVFASVGWDPWAMVVGADSASFVVYADGLVLRRIQPEDAPAHYVSKRLPAGDVAAFVAGILGDVAAFVALDEHYVASDASDQPLNTLMLRTADGAHFTSVYGHLVEDEARKRSPALFVAAFDRLGELALEGAEPWLPERIEALAWDFSYSKATPLAWPEGWPGLDHETTRPSESTYSIFLPPERLGALRELLGRRAATQAVEISGRKMMVGYRIPIPGEEHWMR